MAARWVLGRAPLVVPIALITWRRRSAVAALETSFFGAGRQAFFVREPDKDLPGMLRVLAPHFATIVLTRFANVYRSSDTTDLVGLLPADFAGEAEIIEPAEEAWRRACDLARAEDLICVTGSVFLAGELRPLMLAQAALLARHEAPGWQALGLWEGGVAVATHSAS